MVKNNVNRKIKTNITKNKNEHKSLRQIIEDKIQKYSKKTKQPFVSTVRLFTEIQNFHKNKTINLLKFYLKSTLSKLTDKRILIKYRDSYRFSKIYLNKKVQKLKILKIKKNKNSKTQTPKSKRVVNRQKTKIPNIKITPLSANQNKKVNKAINKLKSKLDQKLSKSNAQITTVSTLLLNPSSNLTTNVLTKIAISSKTNIKEDSNKKGYKRMHDALWQYFDNNKSTNTPSVDGWYDYDPEASDIVEDAWQKYIVHRGMNDVRSVKSGEWEYMVDFLNWTQQNIIHSAHTKRNIRRLDDKGNVTKNPYQ